MNWKVIWMNLFGTTEFAGLNLGFWVAMGVVALIVVAMNLAFWGVRPLRVNRKAPDPADRRVS